jgi:hypothetical protein
MRFRHVLGLLAFSMLPATLAAQGGCPALQAGSTVRLHAPSAATYTLPQSVRPGDSEIALPAAGGSARMIRCADLQKIQVRTGTRSRSQTAFRRAGVGLLAGAVVGAGLGYIAWENSDGDDWQIFSREESALVAAVYLGGAGAVVGGVYGYAAPGSRWEDVPVTPRPSRAAEGLRIMPAAGGAQVRVSYTLAF